MYSLKKEGRNKESWNKKKEENLKDERRRLVHECS